MELRVLTKISTFATSSLAFEPILRLTSIAVSRQYHQLIRHCNQTVIQWLDSGA